ncbi:hypothetical protein [Serratia proteamaculans]|uniref:hypothetical protein n=1 Tax=Serratia proteamaculans TaxID=28151 RepID=UPI003D017882
MSNYLDWEEAVTLLVADALEASYSDASGVVEAQGQCMQQSWAKSLDAKQTAAKILAAAQQ